jgi:hypothetical protein
MRLSDSLTASADYQSELRLRQTTHVVSAGLKLTF